MRKLTPLLFVGGLALCGLSVANAKSYHITVTDTTAVGQAQLKPGSYTVQVKGSNAVIKNDESSKTVTTPVKVQTNKTKYDTTAVDTVKDGDTVRLKSIELGGSDQELLF